MKSAQTTLLAGGLLTVFQVFMVAPTTAVAEGYGGYAGAFLRMGAGAVTMACGDAGVARSVGAEQALYNPAGLPFSPSSDVHLTYHALSLDRRLAHVSAMAQIPKPSFWSGPMRQVVVLNASADTDLPRLAYLEDTRSLNGRERFKVEDYLIPLAEAILTYGSATEISSDTSNKEPELLTRSLVLKVGGRLYNGEIFLPVLLKIRRLASKRRVDKVDGIVVLLREQYLRVLEKPAAIALSWTHAGTDNIENRDIDGNLYGTVGYYENRFSLGFGVKIHRTLSAGVTLGVLYALVPDMLENETKAITSTTFGADIGLQYRPFSGNGAPYGLKTLVLGIAAYDLAAKNTWNTTGYWSLGTIKTDHYPRRYRVGLSVAPYRGIEAFFDLETDFDLLLRPKGGLELSLLNGLPATGSPGRNKNPIGQSHARPYGVVLRGGIDRDRPTFGLGLILRLSGLGLSRIDYAYVLDQVSPEATQIISWRFMFEI